MPEKAVGVSAPFASQSPYSLQLAYNIILHNLRVEGKGGRTSALNSVNSKPRQSSSIIFWVLFLGFSGIWYACGPAVMDAECVFCLHN